MTGHVRWGAKVRSPVIMEGEAHFLYALEELEALRWAHFARPDGIIAVNRHRLLPASVTVGGEAYPEDAVERLAGYGRVLPVEAQSIAATLGNTRTANIVLLGAMSAHVPGFTFQQWQAAVSACVPPRHRELNLAALERGRNAASALLPSRPSDA